MSTDKRGSNALNYLDPVAILLCCGIALDLSVKLLLAEPLQGLIGSVYSRQESSADKSNLLVPGEPGNSGVRLRRRDESSITPNRKLHSAHPENPLERFRAFFVLYVNRSEEHTSELQSLMRISYAVFCFKKKKKTRNTQN